MYDDIGGKVKLLARIGFFIGAVLSILLGITILKSGNYLNLENESLAKLINVLSGISIIIFGLLGSWLSSWYLYCIGETAENVEIMLKKLEKIDDQTKAPNTGLKSIKTIKIDE